MRKKQNNFGVKYGTETTHHCGQMNKQHKKEFQRIKEGREVIIRGAFNKFPYFFFVQVFKIGVDSWKFIILLLYILWDDWPIFTISGLNEQLHQQLEYTPTKAWLSQLVNFKNAVRTWRHFRRTICYKILFLAWKKCHRNLWNASDCFRTILHESSIRLWVA